MSRLRLIEIPVVFYRTSGGAEPVIEWLRTLPPEDRRVIGTDLATVQWVGQSECRCAGRLAKDSGKSGVHCQAGASPDCCSSCTEIVSAWCTGSSRRRRRRRRTIWNWRGGA